MRQRDKDFIYSFVPYQKSLLERYKKLKINELGQQLAKADETEVNELLERINEYNHMTIGKSDRTKEIGDEALERLYKDNPNEHILRTGFTNLDRAIGGFKLRTMSVIGANSGLGKTAFSLNVAWRMLRAGYDVTF